jgi:hypothetical protein
MTTKTTKPRRVKYHPEPHVEVPPWTAEDEARRRSQRCSVCGGEPAWDLGEYLFEGKCWACRNPEAPGADPIENAKDDEHHQTEEFLAAYEGTFQFLLDVKARVASGWVLTPKQIAAVLRCKAREESSGPRSEPEAPAETGAETPSEAPPIRNGYYTVVLEDGTHVTLRIKAHWDKARVGQQVASYLAGSDNENDYVGFAFITGTRFNLWKKFQPKRNPPDADNRMIKALNTLIHGDPGEAGLRYAIESSRCCACNRRLTVPASIHRGMGPECAGR